MDLWRQTCLFAFDWNHNLFQINYTWDSSVPVTTQQYFVSLKLVFLHYSTCERKSPTTQTVQ